MDRDKVKIDLHLNRDFFIPGETLRGRLHLTVTRSVPVKAVRLRVIGKEKALRYAHYRTAVLEDFTHFEQLLTFFGERETESVENKGLTDGKARSKKKSATKKAEKLASGEYDFPFHIDFPATVPPSLYAPVRHMTTKIYYFVEVNIVMPSGFHGKKRRYITIFPAAQRAQWDWAHRTPLTVTANGGSGRVRADVAGRHIDADASAAYPEAGPAPSGVDAANGYGGNRVAAAFSTSARAAAGGGGVSLEEEMAVQKAQVQQEIGKARTHSAGPAGAPPAAQGVPLQPVPGGGVGSRANPPHTSGLTGGRCEMTLDDAVRLPVRSGRFTSKDDGCLELCVRLLPCVMALSTGAMFPIISASNEAANTRVNRDTGDVESDIDERSSCGSGGEEGGDGGRRDRREGSATSTPTPTPTTTTATEAEDEGGRWQRAPSSTTRKGSGNRYSTTRNTDGETLYTFQAPVSGTDTKNESDRAGMTSALPVPSAPEENMFTVSPASSVSFSSALSTPPRTSAAVISPAKADGGYDSDPQTVCAPVATHDALDEEEAGLFSVAQDHRVMAGRPTPLQPIGQGREAGTPTPSSALVSAAAMGSNAGAMGASRVPSVVRPAAGALTSQSLPTPVPFALANTNPAKNGQARAVPATGSGAVAAATPGATLTTYDDCRCLVRLTLHNGTGKKKIKGVTVRLLQWLRFDSGRHHASETVKLAEQKYVPPYGSLKPGQTVTVDVPLEVPSLLRLQKDLDKKLPLPTVATRSVIVTNVITVDFHGGLKLSQPFNCSDCVAFVSAVDETNVVPPAPAVYETAHVFPERFVEEQVY